MEKISYKLLTSLKQKPCQKQLDKFVAQFGKDVSITYEEYKNLEWADLSGVMYLYNYFPGVLSNKEKIEDNFKDIMFVILKNVKSLLPHPTIDMFFDEYEKTGIVSEATLEGLEKLKSVFNMHKRIVFYLTALGYFSEFDISNKVLSYVCAKFYTHFPEVLLLKNKGIKELI